MRERKTIFSKAKNYHRAIKMGNLISLYSRSVDPDPFESRMKAGEEKWLDIGNVPCEEDNTQNMARKVHSKNNMSKHAGNVFAIYHGLSHKCAFILR